MVMASVGRRATWAFMLAFGIAGCSGVGGIDSSLVSPISNDDTFATIGYLWGGVRSAISSKREPDVGPFSLALSFKLPCTRGGQGSYQGTLTGTKTATGGSGTLSITASLAACQFDDRSVITTISASGVTAIGTIAIVNDTWGDINIHMVAPSVTVNGVACPGGVDVQLTGTTPSAPPTSTGTSCGRTGAVALP